METPPTLSTRIRQWLLYGGATGGSTAELDRAYVINVYSILGFLALVVFGLLHIFVEENVLLGQIELAIGVVMAINMLAFRLTRTIAVARTFLLVSILLLLQVLLITGGTRNTGIFWFFIFPLTVFFVAGKKQGLWWMAGLMAVVGGILALGQLDVVHTPYNLIAIRQLLISLSVVTFGVYVYQGARERALHEMRESRRDLQEYLDHMTTFNVKINLSGTVLFANKVAKETSGLGEKLIGTNFLEGPWWGFDAQVRRRVAAAFYKALTGEHVNYDEQLKAVSTTGSSILTVNFSMMPIFEGERIKYVLAEARDISAEQAIDRAKSEFVALASRQLRTPVSVISRFTELLLGGDAGTMREEQMKYVRQIYENNQHMDKLIRDMLIVSNLELGSLPVKPVRSDLAKLSQEVLQELRASLLGGRKLEIGEDYAEDLPAIDVDPEIVKIILRCLVSNAVTYTPDTGRVSIRISKTEDKLHAESQGSLYLEVQDSGHGIPEADQKKLFTKFFRAAGAQQKNTGGTGLGLYIVKRLMDYVGGRITFTSKENVGTIFVIMLPLEGMRPAAAPAQSSK